MAGFSTAAERAAVSMSAQSTSAPCFRAGIPILWKLLPAQPADTKKTSLSRLQPLTETIGKAALQVESCREMLLGGDAISALLHTREWKARMQLRWQRQ